MSVLDVYKRQGQDLSMVEIKSIFEDIHFVDYRGRPDSRRHQFIKTLKMCIRDRSVSSRVPSGSLRHFRLVVRASLAPQ